MRKQTLKWMVLDASPKREVLDAIAPSKPWGRGCYMGKTLGHACQKPYSKTKKHRAYQKQQKTGIYVLQPSNAWSQMLQP